MLDPMTVTSERIELPVADGTALPAYLADAGGRGHAGTRPGPGGRGDAGTRLGSPARTGVIVAHELFGVNPDIQGVVDRLADAGYLALAPEFYHRHAEAGRWLERDDAGRAEGFALLHQLRRDQALADVDAAMGWLGAQPGIERTAVIGFSAGGHLAYLAACRRPISRTAVIYGGWLPTTDIPLSQPEPTLDLTRGITGRILYVVGENDMLIDAGQRAQIGAALAQAGIDHELVVCPGAGHAFFWPGTEAFNQAATDDAWGRILGLLAG